MKIILLLSLVLICSTSKLHAQLYEKAKPVYEAALGILQSDYAKGQFTPKITKLETEDDLPDTITVEDNRLFNFGKFMRSKKGKVEAKHIPIILKIINSDSDISTEEKALLDAVKNSKQITIYSTQASNKGDAVNLAFDAEAEAKQLLGDFYAKGVAINSLQHMHLTFIDSKSINNWLNYYYGSEQQKELAIAFMRFKVFTIDLRGGSDFKGKMRLFKNFVESIQVKFSQRNESLHPEASRNLILNIIKEFDEAGYISLPDFVYMEKMKK